MNTIFERFLVYMEVKHTHKYANTLYNEHPYKYTMYGLNQMLSQYAINSEALKLDNKDELLKLQVPFIAEFANDLVIVKSITKYNVGYEWYDENINLKFEEFKDQCTGVVLLAYPDSKSKEPNYWNHFKQVLTKKIEDLLIGLVLVTLIAYLSWENMKHFNLLQIANVVLGVMGAFVSYLIIKKSLRIESKSADRLCSVFKKQSCNDILETSAAKLFNRYGWGQIGFAYFISNLITILLFPLFAYNYIPLISIMALVYPIWSIWYQKYKAKSWCPLCLIIQMILILQGVIGIMLFSSMFNPFYNATHLTIIILPFVYIITSLTTCKVSELYKKANELENMESKFKLLKYRKEIIDKMFETQRAHDNSSASSRLIFCLRNTPQYRVTVFSNPYCNPCANIHKKIEDLYLAGCEIQYVLTFFSKELSTTNRYIYASYEQYGAERTWKLLSEWYAGGKSKHEKFFKNDLNIETSFVKEEFEAHYAWKRNTEFNATPTILFNGKELPDIYNIEDILFIVKNGL